MTESLQKNQELLNSEARDLSNLKREIKSSRKHENHEEKRQESPYKNMIENQEKPIMYWNRNNPEISITFDDGYWSENITNILDTLRWSWIKATFFILWDCLRKNPTLRKQAVEDWHQICCHTFSHIYLSNSSETTNLTLWLNKNIKINEWINNVKSLLWDEYYEKLKYESWEWFPQRIKSDLLLRTEILTREEEVKRTLWEDYLKDMKQNHPFFRFPGGNGCMRKENIAVLKELWYLSIYWSDDKPASSSNKPISNWSIPLFHFNTRDRQNIKTYIENMKKQNKTPRPLSDIIKP